MAHELVDKQGSCSVYVNCILSALFVICTLQLIIVCLVLCGHAPISSHLWGHIVTQASHVWFLLMLSESGAAPPPFRPSNPALCGGPALCGSCPLVTPYYCRLGDLLCYNCMLYSSTILCVYACVISVFFVFFCVVFLYSFLLQYFDTVGWVFWPVKTVSHITYTVLEGT